MKVKCLDTYCELYRDLFVEVRTYEAFKYLHLGIISDIKRKTLPAIAKSVGLKNEQFLLQRNHPQPTPHNDNNALSGCYRIAYPRYPLPHTKTRTDSTRSSKHRILGERIAH